MFNEQMILDQLNIKNNSELCRILRECTIFCVNSKKSIKKEATSCIIKLPTKINKGVTSKWILTQN